MGEHKIVLRREGDILYLVLNNPPANQTDFRFFEEFGATLSILGQETSVRGVIMHGAGRHFSSGADVKKLQHQLFRGDREKTMKLLNNSVKAVQMLSELPYPVVAAISGCCIGSGLELALACDYRVATNNCYFAMPEVTFGIMPGCGGTVRLPALTGLGRGIELLLTGGSFLAGDGLEMGIVDRVVQKKELLAVAGQMIESLPGKRKLCLMETPTV